MNENFFFAETKPIDQDNDIDVGIQECLSLGAGKSFITFAGAGSGKTYSLKKALEFLKTKHSDEFSKQGKKIAVVTFTNNAADEIKDRIEQSPIFSVSTVHSFCWAAIAGFNEDIRKWYLETIPRTLARVKDEQNRGRAGKASDARAKTIQRLGEKIEWLAEPRSFIYDPNGVNATPNALSHADVLKIFSHFLISKPMMAEVVVNKFPFIFIDESQDTDHDVINAFFVLQALKSNQVIFGLFGDTMQRIFGGGEPELGKTKPFGWQTFDKKMNHRSARRIVGLGNRIRNEDDKRKQYAREGAVEGHVRYFLLPHSTTNRDKVEAIIRETMAEVTGDIGWADAESKESAILLLEHKMVGYRLGFDDLWDKLSISNKIKDRIYVGENSELNFFANIVFPMADASLKQQRAKLMSILRETKSPLLETGVLNTNKNDPLALARAAEHAFRTTISNENVSFLDVLKVLSEHKLLRIPEKLLSFVGGSQKSQPSQTVFDDQLEHETPDDSEITAWAYALETKFFQIRKYKDYISGNSIYRTHQGVKGNEFDRVMVIMDDEEAGGFLFSYEQYFGTKDLSRDSQKKRDAGEETGLDRTRRLFYVTSTRAKNSLAHVIYTADVGKLKRNLLDREFAFEAEIVEFT